MYTPVRNSKGANRDQIVHDRVIFFSLPLQAMVINRLPKVRTSKMHACSL